MLRFLAAACLLTCFASAADARRVALVVGNADYTAVGRLDNTLRDADLVAASLRAAGFDSILTKRDLGKTGFEATLREFGELADGAEVAFVYYAGHGIEAGGENFLVPTDARLLRDRDLEVEATRLETVLRTLDGARLRVVVLDACRNNPFVSQMQRSVRSRSVGRGLAAIEPEGETLVVYAAKAGATASDGDGTNGPFASALARRLVQPGLEISLLFRAVRDDVLATTGRQQEPFSYGSLSSREFYFVPHATRTGGSVTRLAEPPPPAPSPVQSHDLGGMWRDIGEPGNVYEIRQQGSDFTFERRGRLTNGVAFVTSGKGRVSGEQLSVSYSATFQDGTRSTGRCEGRVTGASDPPRSIALNCVDSVLQSFTTAAEYASPR
jgi:hypothetical protein